jgi:hypothetical protein
MFQVILSYVVPLLTLVVGLLAGKPLWVRLERTAQGTRIVAEMAPTLCPRCLVENEESWSDPAAAELASALGWAPDGVHLDIRHADAVTYIAKVLREQAGAAARGLSPPDHAAASLHLGIDTPAEQRALANALAAAYERGKPKNLSQLVGTAFGSGAAMLDRIAAGAK